MSIRSDTFHGNFKETMQALFGSLSDADINSFVCMVWAVWRSRNDAIMGGKQQNTQTCNHYFREAQLACSNSTPSNKPSTSNLLVQGAAQEEEEEYVCYVDGSWDDNGRAGVGVILIREGSVVRWISKSVNGMGAAQAEAMSVLEAYQLMQQYSCQKGCVFSDSLKTVDSLSHKQPLIHDWRSFNQIWAAWLLQQQTEGKFRVVHLSREDQWIQNAHVLANQGRMYGWEKEGTNVPVFSLEEQELM